jgi:hypothetical protein
MVDDKCTMEAPAASMSPEDSMEPLTAEVAPATEKEYKLSQAQLENICTGKQNMTVTEQMPRSNDKEAQPGVDDDDEDSNKTVPLCSHKILGIVAAIVILLCVGAVLGVVFSRRMTSEAPTDAPTAAPTSVVDGITDLISSVSFDVGEALQDPSSPQYMALNWLVENTNLDTYSDEKKIQRYVLATLYYSTHGKSWNQNDGWVTDMDECSWYNDAEGPFCIDGSVVELDLFDNMMSGIIPEELALLSNSLCKCKILL